MHLLHMCPLGANVPPATVVQGSNVQTCVHEGRHSSSLMGEAGFGTSARASRTDHVTALPCVPVCDRIGVRPCVTASVCARV